MTYRNDWFEGRQSLKTPPLDCVLDCSAQGSVDDAVEYWVNKLGFDGPAWLIREHLKGCGAWDRRELCDHQANLRRLLWIWFGDLRDYLREQSGPDFNDFCGDSIEDKPLPADLYLAY